MTETALQTVTVVYPALEQVIDLVIDSVDSPNTKRSYRTNLLAFFEWYTTKGRPELSAAVIKAYKSELQRSGLSTSTINLRLAAVKALCREASDNALIDERLLSGIAHVRGVRSSGHKLGMWLDKAQAEALVNAPDVTTLSGKRDRAILSILVGCGLRRDELIRLEFKQILQRENRWVIVDLIGKGNKTRSIPMPAWAKMAVDEWAKAAGYNTGRIFRQVDKFGRLRGDRLTGMGIFKIIHAYGLAIGLDDLAPHDLRRTFAKLAYRGGGDLHQIQLSLGHASLSTTERYIGCSQDLIAAPCDYLGLKL
jgi:site-specific recombinase XerD